MSSLPLNDGLLVTEVPLKARGGRSPLKAAYCMIQPNDSWERVNREDIRKDQPLPRGCGGQSGPSRESLLGQK